MRRLYSTFAGGWPGTGLLLMRLVVGSALVVRASLRLWSDLPPMNVTIPAVLLMGAGILLIVGLWTPIVGTSIALIEIWKMLTVAGDKWVWLLLGTAAAALAMLGPGLFSIDARLFGWKRIEAPPRKTTSNSPLRDSPHTKFLASEEGDIRSTKSLRFAPMWGRARKQNWLHNGYVITTTGAKVGRRLCGRSRLAVSRYRKS